MNEPPPPLEPASVHAFVTAAHGDLELTEELLDAEPGLLNASWDWGGGDFETGLGGASHMGRPDIARFLLERGARLDLPAAALLGMDGVIRAALEADRSLARTLGAHGIPLIAHAEAGGQEQTAELIRSYL